VQACKIGLFSDFKLQNHLLFQKISRLVLFILISPCRGSSNLEIFFLLQDCGAFRENLSHGLAFSANCMEEPD